MPVKELQRQEIHRFTESELGSDNLTFDINKYYSVLNIECKKYETIDKYLELITDYMSFLKEINKLLSLKRFGLRKIGSKIFPSYPSIFEDFEKDKLNSIFDQTKYQKDKSDFLDVLSTIDNIYKFNYRRSIEKGYLKISNEEEKIGFRVILDIDGFVEEKVLNEITIDKKSLIETLNNVYLFHLFKTSVTENFLKNNMK
ncbi:MAG: TIGR04255 family protein [Segetibacter sp.]